MPKVPRWAAILICVLVFAAAGSAQTSRRANRLTTPELVELTNRSRKLVICELVRETANNLTVVRIANGRKHTVPKSSLLEIRRQLSADEAIQTVGLAKFSAWRIARSLAARRGATKIAVLPPTNRNGTITPDGARLAKNLAAELAERGTPIVEMNSFARSLEELARRGTVDDLSARRLARQLDANAVVTGTLSQTRTSRETRLRLVAVDSGRTLADIRHSIQTGGVATAVTLRGGRRFTISERALGVVFSPDGTVIATSNSNGKVKIWNTANGKLLRTFRAQQQRAQDVAFSPNGQWVATACYGGVVQVWDLASFRVVLSVQAHPRNARGAIFSDDGRHLITAGDDNLIKVWDLDNGTEKQVFEGHGGFVRCIRMSPDGKLLASGSNDRTIRLWDPRSGEVVSTLAGHRGYVYCIAFSPDGNLLASSSSDGTAILWDLKLQSMIAKITPSAGPMTCIGFSPDGAYLATGHANETVKVWRVNTQEHVATIDKDDGTVGWLAFSPDGQMLAACTDAEVSVWNFSELVR